MKNKIISIISILLIFSGSFYIFMTSSRPFDLGIEINEKMKEIAVENNLMLILKEIDVSEIKRPAIKKIRIEAHKILCKLNLMTYGHEYSEKFSFLNSANDTVIIGKTLLLGDHLRILEIQLDSNQIGYKKDFENKFNKDHIVWSINN